MKLYVATHNQHKVREISQILPGFEIVPDDPEGVEENAPDFVGNALIKVRAIARRHPGEWCMADDSGLEVRALGGAPGVRSARYAGEPCSTPANNALLLKNLEGVEDRTANFTCAVALAGPDGRERTVVGKCFGRIALSASGAEGFGYDPLFVPDGHGKSFAELSADEKNAISHRGRALAEAKRILGNGERGRVLPWLRFFRVVNLPTVPGDVFVGAAVSAVCLGKAPNIRWVLGASIASVLVYMFGLADNDIAGAKRDRGRPIPDGEISLGVARTARATCLLAAIGVASAVTLPGAWWGGAFALLALVVLYNRTKWSFLMGLCRGENLLCGVAAAGVVECGGIVVPAVPSLAAFAAWTLYIWAVTKYSEGEESDPARKRRVGMLVGGMVYLQLAALIGLTLAFPGAAALRPLLVAGAAMLALRRILRTLLPRVSAS